MKSFEGEEFVKALSSKEGLELPAIPIALTGMVKPLATNQSTGLLFAPGISCNVWIPIPANLIERVDHLGKMPCRDHQHDYVRLHLKRPTTEEATVFANLLQAQLSTTEEMELESPWGEEGLETSITERSWGWRPPWTWSRCAKCKLEVNAFITGTVMVACAAAGTTGPGALAVAQSLIAAKYGLAAWEAVKAVIFSASVDEVSRKICKAQGKC